VRGGESRRGISSGLLLLLFAASPVLAADQPQPDAPAKAALPPADGPACKITVVKFADPANYYAGNYSARVVVEFTILESGAKLADFAVIQSSPFPDMDTAALHVIEHSRFKITCPAARARMAVQFTRHLPSDR